MSPVDPRRRKASDPPSDNDTPTLARTDTYSSDGQHAHSTRTGSSGSFSRLFGGSSELRRIDSQVVSSPPQSTGGSFAVSSTAGGSLGSTPFRTRTSSFVGSKHTIGSAHNHHRSRSSLPAAVTHEPFQSVSDSTRSHSAASRGSVELDSAQERNPPTSSSRAVTSDPLPSKQAHLRSHSLTGHLRPSIKEHLSERRLSLSDLPQRDAALTSSLSLNLVDTAAEVGDVSGRILSAFDFRPRFGRKRPRKLAREGYDRPVRPDVLDKNSTKKLTKFWDLTESSAKKEKEANRNSEEREFTFAEFFANERSPTYAAAPVETAPRPAFRPRLASISEHSREVVGPLPRFKMDSSLLTPGSRLLADEKDKQRRVKDAKEMYEQITRNAERSNTPLPPYEFLELIGKGSFGLVYKCRDKRDGNLVAIKITNVDNELEFDETIRDFQKEVSTLQQLKSNNTKNVNVIHDAFDLHSQLWIVADYCTGGSIRTLMRAWERNGKPNGLPEHFVIPIARELAIALKGMHEMHIIHRDIKCANVYITEDGEIQLGDFGVVGVIDDGNSKRKTVIGTPHYMPKELIDNMESNQVKEGYGTEVDIWAYGCTIYEMATGKPPHSNVMTEDLSDSMEAKGGPRLEGSEYSTELCDLVAFCLKMDPKARPTADAILQHPLIVDTSKQYPTSSLVKLIEKFKIWEHGGGSRSSLWMAAPSDAAKGTVGDDDGQFDDYDDVDEWNFSTSDDFDRRFSQMPSVPEGDLSYLQAPAGAGLPPGLPPINTQDLSVAERIKREHSELSANRGERSLARVFNTSDEDAYQLTSPPMEQTTPPAAEPPPSDLPLRNFTSNAPTRESMIEIDLNEADVNETATSTFALHMDAISENTIKPMPRKAAPDEDEDDDFQFGEQQYDASKRDTMAWTFPKAEAPQPKRGTMDWTFSTAEQAQPEEPEFSMGLPPIGGGGDLPPGFRPGLKHTTTEPIGHFRDFSHDDGSSATSPDRHSVTSMIDLDMGLADPPRHLEDPAEIVRPSTASSATGSTMTDMTSGNPFDLEDDPVQNEIDRNRFSYHKQWQSEGGGSHRNSLKSVQMHARGSSLSSTDSGMDNHMASTNAGLGDPMPPSAVFESGLSLEQDDANQWPNFSGFDSLDTSPQYLPTLNDIPRLGETGFPLDRNLRANGISSRSREPSNEPPGPEIAFPDIVPPNPNSLHEDADPRLLEDELGHQLNDLATALSGVEQSLRQYANIDEFDDHPTSDIESGFESNNETTTEDEAAPDSFLTARRNQPRSRSPHFPPNENSQ